MSISAFADDFGQRVRADPTTALSVGVVHPFVKEWWVDPMAGISAAGLAGGDFVGVGRASPLARGGLRLGGRAVQGFGGNRGGRLGAWNPGWALPTDVDQLKAQLDANMAALNTAIGACANFPADLATTWGGFYAAWQALSQQIGSWPYTGIIAAEFSSLYNDMIGYQGQLAAWQTLVAQTCSGYTPPPAVVVPTLQPSPPSGPSSTLDTIKTIGEVVGGIAVAGVATYAAYKLVQVTTR